MLLRLSALTVAGATVIDAVADPLPDVAVIVAEALEATALVVTVNVAEVAPAATVTEVGTVAADVLEDDRVTTTPPVGAASAMFTVPVVETPPVTEEEANVTEVGCGGVSASVAVAELPAVVAVIVADEFVPTALVVTLNVAEVAPEATVTEAGTVTEALDEVSVTTCPLAGAAALILTVPVSVVPFPPSIVDALKLTLETDIPRTFETNPWKFRAPQPVTVSQPATAVEVEPLGSVPLLPDVTSKKIDERPL